MAVRAVRRGHLSLAELLGDFLGMGTWSALLEAEMPCHAMTPWGGMAALSLLVAVLASTVRPGLCSENYSP